MAEFGITAGTGIVAVIAGGDKNGFEETPIILDPLSESYSGFAPLCFYELVVSNISGLTDIILLQNGKNSRFTASGSGTCDITLNIEDELGNTDSDTITITITTI